MALGRWPLGGNSRALPGRNGSGCVAVRARAPARPQSQATDTHCSTQQTAQAPAHAPAPIISHHPPYPMSACRTASRKPQQHATATGEYLVRAVGQKVDGDGVCIGRARRHQTRACKGRRSGSRSPSGSRSGGRGGWLGLTNNRARKVAQSRGGRQRTG
jgi:hypothetical protein